LISGNTPLKGNWFSMAMWPEDEIHRGIGRCDSGDEIPHMNRRLRSTDHMDEMSATTGVE
jgi:hypothetical protein